MIVALMTVDLFALLVSLWILVNLLISYNHESRLGFRYYPNWRAFLYAPAYKSNRADKEAARTSH